VAALETPQATLLKYRFGNIAQMQNHLHVVDGRTLFFYRDGKGDLPGGARVLLEFSFADSEQVSTLRGNVLGRVEGEGGQVGMWIEFPDGRLAKKADQGAAAMSGRCGLPVRKALERVKNTLPQVGLGAKERRENIRGAFKPRMGAAPGRRPVLIDDVETSRSTLEEAARTLRAAGAHAVFALTVCWDRPAPGSDDGQRPPGDRGSLPYARGS